MTRPAEGTKLETRLRLAVWVSLGILLLIGVAILAAPAFIRHGGPQTLNTIDRIASGGKGGELVETAQFGSDPAQKLAVFRSDEASQNLPIMVFVHGGGWYWGNPDDYAFAGRNFAERGFLAVVPGYRLHPDAVYPAMLEDTAGAIAWIFENAERLGGDPQQIWLAGHSAGAYNVVQVALEEKWLTDRGVPAEALAGVIGISGPYDFYPFESEFTRQSFEHVEDPEITQPGNHARADAPPLLLISGDSDTVVHMRNTNSLASGVEAAGGQVETEIYPGMTHNTPLLALAYPWRSRRSVMQRIEQFVAKHQSGTSGKIFPSSLDVQGETR